MRIYRMTATFGKLEHETLTLEPGLNVIEAPNEWGKTTWCAFLMTMLYGLETRAKSTKTALADKEKYAPWSGSLMAGRIDLHWNGRDITIERSTKSRSPMGIFRAYETQSGLAVPELTAANCGQMLLGVERSVYRSTGFIRQSDMPVTQDDALRRRLNALVTTGDESSEGDTLAAKLKELKNACRYNRSGLIPQAEAQRRELEHKIDDLDTLSSQCRSLRERLGETRQWVRALENHQDALRYAAAETDARHVAQAREQRDRAEAAMTALEQTCGRQHSREKITAQLQAIQAFRQASEACCAEELPAQPQPPEPPERFRAMTPEQAEEMVNRDSQRHQALCRDRSHLIYLALALVCLAAGLAAIAMKQWFLTAALAPAVLLLLLSLRNRTVIRRQRETLEEKYGSDRPEDWTAMVNEYRAAMAGYHQSLMAYRAARGDLEVRLTALEKQREALFGSQSPEEVHALWQHMEKNWENYDLACQAFAQTDRHLKILQAMAQEPVPRPAMEDPLTYTAEETQALLADARGDQQRYQSRLDQQQGRMESLGDRDALQAQLQAVEQRIEKLEQIHAAAVLALDTLAQARQELQRRFAPRISRRAQELLQTMTAGRYDRLTLSQDLSLLAGADQEDTLREILWRSDGTIDQLYLALRLAVAEELIPQAPLVLDDAFVRFDDTRLAAALDILRKTGENTQVLLFTCQHREKELLGED